VIASVRLRALDILAASRADLAPSVLGALSGWGEGGPCTIVGSSLGARRTNPVE